MPEDANKNAPRTEADKEIRGYFPPKPIDPPWETTAEAGRSIDSVRRFKRPEGPADKKPKGEDEHYSEGN